MENGLPGSLQNTTGEGLPFGPPHPNLVEDGRGGYFFAKPAELLDGAGPTRRGSSAWGGNVGRTRQEARMARYLLRHLQGRSGWSACRGARGLCQIKGCAAPVRD
jgi:hypothetical protein